MSKMIVYGSKYGASMRYAEALAEKTGIPCLDVRKVKTLEGCEAVVHIGGLYAGGVRGLSHTVKLLEKVPGVALTVITVGLADPDDEDNRRSIRESVKKQIPEAVMKKTKLFHLRGGIDYSRLSMVHRTMMKLLYSQLKKIPPEERGADARGLFETYGKKVDFVDLGRLEEIADNLGVG